MCAKSFQENNICSVKQCRARSAGLLIKPAELYLKGVKKVRSAIKLCSYSFSNIVSNDINEGLDGV